MGIKLRKFEKCVGAVEESFDRTYFERTYRGMRKSNWFVLALASIAAAVLLWLWYYLGFNRVDSPLDLVVAIIWWVVIVVVAFAIKHTEDKRRERMRTAFVGDGFLYNPETGLLVPELGESEVALLERTLADLTYSNKIVALDKDEQLPFRWVVHSVKFDKAGEVWKGEIRFVHKPEQDPIPFESRGELVASLYA